jgi:DNA repair protein SbcC/Rad50
MKPLLLTLQAVGPYAGRQTIDFRAVLDSGLFGIYGATGSGKSTIFSAMTFALFGEAARSEQHAATLRSDHADAGLLTEVELVFESAGRTYRIVRQPEQTRPAKRGGGETKETHKAWLFDVTGLDLDTLSDTNPGKVLAEIKVKIVDDAIEKLLGYGAAQFRQIVLLPQGRFEAFLSADTKERLDILRDLFDVSLYRRLTERLKTDADAAEKKVAAARAACIARLSAENFATMDALAEGIADVDIGHRDQSDAAAKAKAEWDAALHAYQAAAQTDAKFIEHLSAEQHLATLDASRPEIDALTARLKLARIVASLADAASTSDTARTDVDAAQKRQNAAAERLKKAEADAQRAQKTRDALAQQSASIETEKSELHTLRDHAARLTTSATLRTVANAAQTKARESSTAVENAKATLATLTSRKEATTKALATAQSAQVQRLQLNATASHLRERLAAAKAYEDATQKASAAQTSLQRAEADAASAATARQTAETAFATAETALLENHAAHLAAHLNPGEPCAVCGSADHPAPARGTSGSQRLDETYARAKATLDTARARANEAATQFEIAKQALTERQTSLAVLTPPERTAAALTTELQAIEANLSRLAAPADEAALSASLETLAAEIAAATTFLERAQDAERDAAKSAAAAQQSLDDSMAAIPSHLRDASVLQAAITTLTKAISDFDRDTQAAVLADQNATAQHAAAERETETIAAEVTRLAAHLTCVEQNFADRLAANSLTAEEYERRRPDVAAIPDLEAQIRHYEDQCTAASDRLKRATAAIASLTRPNLVALASARDTAANAFDMLNTTATEASARLAQLRKLQTDLATEGQRLDVLEKETAPLRELSEAFSGKTYQKIDLETFAISTLFDRVLEAANLRLGPMTCGRYSLVRETEGKGNARRGLGIAVEDTYTGRQRPTSTLSGGETFIAALALALGLSDIVESAHGSVRLDTIFIDEGFGSLDSENDGGTLETVLQTLQDLVGTTRAIGLISHVPLVQQAIPNGFFVTKTPGGSHIEVRV